MGEQQGGYEPIAQRMFTVDNRIMRRRIWNAIVSMYKHKAVGMDNVHAEMLQNAPEFFASVLA